MKKKHFADNLWSEKQERAITNFRVRELKGFKRSPKGYSWTVCKQTGTTVAYKDGKELPLHSWMYNKDGKEIQS
jgi:hypothetical protein